MQNIVVKKNCADIRLDKFLSKEFFSYSRSEIIKNIKEKNVLVNNKKKKPSYILKNNDSITFNFRPAHQKLIPNKNIQFKIIYQDKNILALNKPAGLKVHPIFFTETNTLVNGILEKFPEIETIGDASPGSMLRPGIVHRLDQDTSGIMIVAKNQESFNELKKIFQTRKITKKYVALVLGKMKDKHNLIEKAIAKSSSYKKQVIANSKTKTKVLPAVTEYKVIREFVDFSLVEASPKTGRTHQIRIHFFSLGNPVAGDKKYKLKKFKKIALPERQLLHAESLNFELFGQKYAFRTKIPQDFQDFLTKIK